MKHLALTFAILAPPSALASSECRMVWQDNPVYLSIEAQHGGSKVSLPDAVAAGVPGSATPREVPFVIRAGAIDFSITPLSTCRGGLLLRYRDANGSREVTAPWNQVFTLSGDIDSGRFVAITPRKSRM